MSEHRQIGQIVEEITADTATVVVGNVIDESLVDTVKVTIVATGLGGKSGARSIKKPKLEPVVARATGTDDYDAFDTPAAMRQKEEFGIGDDFSGEEFLDIPAFLRNQTD